MRLLSVALAAISLLGATQSEAQSVQPPATRIGIPVGDDSTLADWSQLTDYFEYVDRESEWLSLERIGRSTLGKPLFMATITSPRNQAHLDEIRDNQARLADPRGLSAADERRIVGETPAVVLINNNLHSTEIASSQFSAVLAHELVTNEEYRELLDDVVVLLIPSANPDGLDTVVSWYRQHRGTPFEAGPLPWLYHPYVGHDNNRDWYMLTQVETRAITRILYGEWFPQIVWDVHQMGSRGARMFLPPFADPVNPNLDPVLVEATNLVGTAMATELYDSGRTGIQHGIVFDLWWHGGFRTVPARHNMIGILSEVASARLASPIYFDPDSIENQPATVDQPSAWRGGTWGLPQIIDYELVAARGLLQIAARDRERFVRRFVQLGRRSIERGLTEAPYGYLLPRSGNDPTSLAQLIDLLQLGGVEVLELNAPVTLSGHTYREGTVYIPLAQPFRSHVKDLFDVQIYPDGNDSPYDASGWTLPMQMGLAFASIDIPGPLDTRPLTSLDPVAQRAEGAGGSALFSNSTLLESTMIARALESGMEIGLAESGSLVLSGRQLQSFVSEWSDLGVAFHLVNSVVRRGSVDRLPRIGVYNPSFGNIDEGWTRWVLERYGIPYERVVNEQIRRGELGELDVLVFPSQSAASIVSGLDSTRIPEPYSGGIGDNGVDELRAWVADGGALVALGSSTRFVLERFDIPISEPEVDSEDESSRFFAPGSIFGVNVTHGTALTSGLPDSVSVYLRTGVGFQVEEPARVLATYWNEPLRSGLARHVELVAGTGAMADVGFGDGRIVLFGFRPQHRGQTNGTFKFLFNALLLSGLE